MTCTKNKWHCLILDKAFEDLMHICNDDYVFPLTSYLNIRLLMFLYNKLHVGKLSVSLLGVRSLANCSCCILPNLFIVNPAFTFIRGSFLQCNTVLYVVGIRVKVITLFLSLSNYYCVREHFFLLSQRSEAHIVHDTFWQGLVRRTMVQARVCFMLSIFTVIEYVTSYWHADAIIGPMNTYRTSAVIFYCLIRKWMCIWYPFNNNYDTMYVLYWAIHNKGKLVEC